MIPLLIVLLAGFLSTAQITEAQTIQNRVGNSFGFNVTVSCIGTSGSNFVANLMDSNSTSIWSYNTSDFWTCYVTYGCTSSFFYASVPAMYSAYADNYVIFMRGDGIYTAPGTNTNDLLNTQDYNITGFIVYNRAVNQLGCTLYLSCNDNNGHSFNVSLSNDADHSWSYSYWATWNCSSQTCNNGPAATFTASSNTSQYQYFDYNYVIFMKNDALYLSPSYNTNMLTQVSYSSSGS